MALATRHRNDPAPILAPAPHLEVRREDDAATMAALQGRTACEMARRFTAGHRAYVAYWEGVPAAWGWVATRSAEIGELGSAFQIPEGERYLWNFVTAKSHRGLGVYPRLLDAIVRAEGAEAERFWIAYAPENHASGSGIRKAGFTTVAELSFDADGRPAVRGEVQGAGALAAGVLGLPVVEAPLSPCWRCVQRGGTAATRCAAGRCTCDYQRPEVGCAH
jgi:ribosomal protein S18 acetylase RimI-like enzyme